MKATHILVRFMVASIATFSALHYFGSSYESLLLLTGIVDLVRLG